MKGIKRLITGKHVVPDITYFCKHCHKILHCPGLIDERTGYPYKDFWGNDGQNKPICLQCYNKVTL